jgi:hypothetical protein
MISSRAALLAGTVGVATALMIAAPAHATVTQMGATPDMSYGLGTNYGTGCDYHLDAADTDAAAPVTFYDNGKPIGVANPAGGHTYLPWVPATPGRHVIQAVQAGQPATAPVAWINLDVGTGVHIGYPCAVFGG